MNTIYSLGHPRIIKQPEIKSIWYGEVYQEPKGYLHIVNDQYRIMFQPELVEKIRKALEEQKK